MNTCDAAGVDEPLSKEEQEQSGGLRFAGWAPDSLQLAAGGPPRSAPGLPQQLESQWPGPASEAAHLGHPAQRRCGPQQGQGAMAQVQCFA